MDPSLQRVLGFLEGPLFRFAFALMVLGVLRNALLSLAETVGSYLVLDSKPEFWRRARLRILWHVFPPIVLRRLQVGGLRIHQPYHAFLYFVSLVFRLGVVLVPTFMAAHLYLWERAWKIAWPALPGGLADILAIITVISGCTLFLGQLYSGFLRATQPAWTFFKPLILLLPFLTGVLAMHPTFSPADYHVVMVIHTLSAAAAFVLVPFARLLSGIHTPLEQLFPQCAWRITDSRAAAQIPLESEVAV